MAHPLNAAEYGETRVSDLCPWMQAYLLLRSILLDPKNGATPMKHMASAFTVVEAELARNVEVPLTSIYGLIQADYDRFTRSKIAKDEATATASGE